MDKPGAAVVLLACGIGLLAAVPSRATVEMEKEARKLGFPAKNCLYCHASPHAVEKMKATARELQMAKGNCLQCHGATIPAKLNDRGRWLVREKGAPPGREVRDEVARRLRRARREGEEGLRGEAPRELRRQALELTARSSGP